MCRFDRQLVLCAVLFSIALIAGCEGQQSTSAWNWTPSPAIDSSPRVPQGNAVIQPNSGFYYAQGDEYAPEFARRDAKLGVQDRNPYDSWMAWPVEDRPSLDRQGSYRSSRDAYRYTYPQTQRARSSRSGHYHGRSRRVY